MKRKQKCPICKGTGLLAFNGGSENPDEDVVDCGKCDGTGEVEQEAQHGTD